MSAQAIFCTFGNTFNTVRIAGCVGGWGGGGGRREGGATVGGKGEGSARARVKTLCNRMIKIHVY